MDSSSSEVSVKIRAAIKAKLEELGAYADEELPDYIMVMVANKKTKDQMNDDLNLFLGKNSNVFTKWSASRIRCWLISQKTPKGRIALLILAAQVRARLDQASLEALRRLAA